MWFSHSFLEVIWQLPSGDRPAPLCSERKRTQKSGPSAQIAYKLSPPKQGSHPKKGSDWPRRVGAKKFGDSLGGERTRPLWAWAVWSLGCSVKGYRGHIIYFSSKKILSPFSLSNILMHRQVNVCVIGARSGDCGATGPLSLQLSWQPGLYHTTLTPLDPCGAGGIRHIPAAPAQKLSWLLTLLSPGCSALPWIL